MANGLKSVDGHSGLTGMDETVPAFNRNRGNATLAVNRSFRGASNLTRPGLSQLRLRFDSDATREIFEQGVIHGVFAYSAWRGVTSPALMIAASNAVLHGEVRGREIYLSPIISGLDKIPAMSWFEQVDDRLYWQNDIDTPFGWKGGGAAYPISGPDKMPRGSAMKYVQGRMALCADSSYLILSDYVYGNGVASTGGTESFIEYQYYNDLGAISSFSEMGDITAFSSLPVLNSVQGMGELLCLCPNGIWSFDPSGVRSDWLYGSRQKRVISGIGCPAPYGHAVVGQDLFFQSTEGMIESLQYVESDAGSYWGRQSVSEEVRSLLQETPEAYRRYVSMIAHDNRVLTSSDITVARSKLGGFHHFGRGIVSLDVSRGTRTIATSGASWDGLWTGVRPSHMAAVKIGGVSKLHIISHDDDGVNRIYAMNNGRHDEFDGKRRAIVSFYDTPFLFSDDAESQIPKTKTLSSVMAFVGGITSPIKLSAFARPMGSPAYRVAMSEKEFRIRRPDAWEFPFYSPQGFVAQGESQDRTECGSIVSGIGIQIRLRMEGDVSLERMNAVCDVASDVKGIVCPDDGVRPSSGDDTDKYSYLINHANNSTN